MLEVGMKAPDFELPDKNGNMVSLEMFKGKKVVLYFYPRDNTPGCTKQACAFAEKYEEFKKSYDVFFKFKLYCFVWCLVLFIFRET